MGFELEGERVRLRRWRPSDRAPFAAMNTDPEVMAFFPAALTRAESDAFADKADGSFDRHGFGLWALQVPDMPFAGFVGLTPQHVDTDFSPCVEVGWRLARGAWGHGYATEAARLALGFGFDRCGLERIYSMTAVANWPSRRVMERIGMVHRPELSFDHPRVAVGSPLRPHVVYTLDSAHSK